MRVREWREGWAKIEKWKAQHARHVAEVKARIEKAGQKKRGH